MRTTIAIILLACSGWAQEYIQTQYSDAPRSNSIGAAKVLLDTQHRGQESRFATYNAILRPFYPQTETPLLLIPVGSVIRLSDGSFTTNATGDVDTEVESSASGKRTAHQRQAMQELITLGTNYSLTARQVRRDPSRVISAALENSKTNATFNGSRPLIQALGALELMRTP